MTAFVRLKKHDYNVDGVFIRLVNCPVPGDHRQLAPTAEAWMRYGRCRWGKGLADITVTWDDNGRVSHRVEYLDGTVLMVE